MEFIIISGLSGAGKSKVASFLEDIGFYVVDNMPAPLMPKFAELCMAGPGRYDRVALVKRIGGFFPEAEFVTAQAGVKYPAVLVVCGCPSRCANVSDLAVPAGRLIYLSGWEELLPVKEKLAEALKGQQARSLTHEEVLDILPQDRKSVV